MSVTKSTVNRPITILIGFVLVVILGFFIQGRLALDLFPEITPPVVVIFTNYEGAGPEEVEKAVSRTLEGVLGNVSNLRKSPPPVPPGARRSAWTLPMEQTWLRHPMK
jgi:HAE1 family hydrophobic/amphiphilic exporter-1